MMKRKESFLLQTIGGECMLVPLGKQVVDTNGLVMLNSTGRVVWDLLAEEHSVDQLAQALVEQFDVDRERAQTDVREFLGEIRQIGLLAS
jgi:hypothetical protein